MILGCIADDFTGAGDLASILAGEGMRTSLIPSIAGVQAADCDAGVVALKTRSMPRDEAVAVSLAALDALEAAGCQQFFFKYCSTFDSTPTGNIGPVAEALARRLRQRAAIVCPAFPANGRTVYQGHLFVGGVPLAESSMRHHPITPMTDSDIRRWLAHQSAGRVGHVPHEIVRRGADAIGAALADDAGLMVVDAICDDDLRAIGTAAADARLLTGGSALAMGLPGNFRRAGLIRHQGIASVSALGPAIILAGSCSTATLAQVERYRASNPSFALDVARLLDGADVLEEADRFASTHAEEAPLIYSTATPDTVAAHGRHPNGAAVAGQIEGLIAALAVRAVARGAKRIIVAGGETSGAVIEAIAPGALTVGPSVAPGVPMLAAGGLAFALKSGNFGDENFFASAVAMLEGRT